MAEPIPVIHHPADGQLGRYVYECKNTMRKEIPGSSIETNNWFKSEKISSLPSDLRAIQLVTNSHDNGGCWIGRGNWTWFELAIEDDGVVRNLSDTKLCIWMSHENRLMTDVPDWRHGKVFRQGHPLLEELKGNPNGCVAVRICTAFQWGFTAVEARLIFYIGCEPCTAVPLATLYSEANGFIVQVPDDAPGLTKMPGTTGESGTDRVKLWQKGSIQEFAICNNITVPAPTRASPTISGPGTDGLGLLLGLSCEQNQGENNSSRVEIEWDGFVIKELSALDPGFPGLTEDQKAKTLLVIDVELLRDAKIEVSTLSWHKELKDIEKGFLDDEKYRNICNCHLIIRIGNEAAVYRNPRYPESGAMMVFEPSNREGGYVRSKSKLVPKDKGALESKLKAVFFVGLAASLMEESSRSLDKDNLGKCQIRQALFNALRWPRRFAAYYISPKGQLKTKVEVTEFDMEHRTDADPILIPLNTGIHKKEARPTTINGDMAESVFNSMDMDRDLLAREIVTWGPGDCLSIIPTTSYGGIVTADRAEIEGFRKAADVIDKYLQGNDEKPLSIAVFGQPGSGKSFGIKEVAKSILLNHGYKAEDTRPLEFNVSLMTEEADLVNAFESIREKQLSRKVPVVLFDEFDSDNCRWLNDFLMPMQHGWFEDKKKVPHTVHPLGRGIYVFIGGTSKTWEEFQRKSGQEQSKKDDTVTDSASSAAAADGTTYAKYYSYDLRANCVSCDTLAARFQSMRDTTLEGKLPIVFFHNFNAPKREVQEGQAQQNEEKWGWLKSFLAPMQDSLFLDNGQTRRIGQGIFVFVQKPDSPKLLMFPDENEDLDTFTQAKGPDFVSRLRGYVADSNGTIDVSPLEQVISEYLQSKVREKTLSLCVTTGKTEEVLKQALNCLMLWHEVTPVGNDKKFEPTHKFVDMIKGYIDITGPNPVAKPLSDPAANGQTDQGNTDWGHMAKIRRAIILRSVLQRRFRVGMKNKIKLKGGALNALLNTRTFYHGVRSIESILGMSAWSINEMGHYEIKFPPVSQLRLHVDAGKFNENLNSNVHEGGHNNPGRPKYTEQSMMHLQVGLALPKDR